MNNVIVVTSGKGGVGKSTYIRDYAKKNNLLVRVYHHIIRYF